MSLVIGVGNPWRGDDAAGLEVARRLAALAPEAVRAIAREGDQAGLVEAWTGAEEVVIVDASSSGGSPGEVRRYDAIAAPLPVRLSSSSTHAFGVGEAIELARALDRLPRSLTVYAIEGESFDVGEGLTDAVERAVADLAETLAGRTAPCA